MSYQVIKTAAKGWFLKRFQICLFLGAFVGFFAGIQVTTGLYATELCKAGDRGFRPSADISQQTVLILFAGRENVREKRDSERLIQCFSRFRETCNRMYLSY